MFYTGHKLHQSFHNYTHYCRWLETLSSGYEPWTAVGPVAHMMQEFGANPGILCKSNVCECSTREMSMKIYNLSKYINAVNYFRAKEIMESQDQYCIVGDSAYPLTRTLMKPYGNPRGRDANGRRLRLAPEKRVFNTALCGLRTVATENVIGLLKQRFPILRNFDQLTLSRVFFNLLVIVFFT